MGKVLIPGGGGGGAISDDITLRQSDVPVGLTAVTSDSDDEIVEGTLTTTASPDKVLKDETFYNTETHQKESGTIENMEAQTITPGASAQTVSCTGKYMTGDVTINAVAGLSAGNIANGVTVGGVAGTYKGLGNATPEHVLKGEKFSTASLSNATGTMTVSSVLSFSAAAYGGKQILLKWQNPAQAAGRPFSGIAINYSTSGYPGEGGSRIYTGVGNNSAASGWSQAIVTMPAYGTKYYFSAFYYATCSAGNIHSATVNATATTQSEVWKTYTSSGSYTIPTGYTKVDIFCVGGGSSGRTAAYAKKSSGLKCAGGGGGGGYTKTVNGVSVSAGDVLNVVVGAGGAGSTAASTSYGTSYYNAGGASSVSRSGTTLCTASGGSVDNYWGTGAPHDADNGCNGGSGGGEAAYPMAAGSAGGSNGSRGGGDDGGKGQGTTTRAWGSSTGTLYAGGGGGGAVQSSSNDYQAGAGGAGGGGNGWGTAGSANTGGGGGGGNYMQGYPTKTSSGAGGSGIVLLHVY